MILLRDHNRRRHLKNIPRAVKTVIRIKPRMVQKDFFFRYIVIEQVLLHRIYFIVVFGTMIAADEEEGNFAGGIKVKGGIETISQGKAWHIRRINFGAEN